MTSSAPRDLFGLKFRIEGDPVDTVRTPFDDGIEPLLKEAEKIITLVAVERIDMDLFKAWWRSL